MAATAAEDLCNDDDIALVAIGAGLPNTLLDTAFALELFDAADDLAALIEVRQRVERACDLFD